MFIRSYNMTWRFPEECQECTSVQCHITCVQVSRPGIALLKCYVYCNTSIRELNSDNRPMDTEWKIWNVTQCNCKIIILLTINTNKILFIGFFYKKNSVIWYVVEYYIEDLFSYNFVLEGFVWYNKIDIVISLLLLCLSMNIPMRKFKILSKFCAFW